MLDLLREARSLMYQFSAMTVFGVPVDWVFHLLGAVLIVFVASRLWPLRWAVRLTLGLILSKELFDVFAKTRVEYIRPPTQDLAFDLTAGLAGLALGWWLARRYPRFLSRRTN